MTTPCVARVGAHRHTHILKTNTKDGGVLIYMYIHVQRHTHKQTVKNMLSSIHTHSHTPTSMHLQTFAVTLSQYWVCLKDCPLFWHVFNLSVKVQTHHVYSSSISQPSAMEPKHTNVQHVVHLFIKTVKLKKKKF